MGTRRQARTGRPRGFDADEALERAVRVLWGKGCEGAGLTGLTGLTGAVGITRTSRYAAFGNEENLFRKARERCAEGPASCVACAWEEPAARQVATAFLRGSVRATARPECPDGCLGIRASLTVWRGEGTTRLRDRFRRAVTEGAPPLRHRFRTTCSPPHDRRERHRRPPVALPVTACGRWPAWRCGAGRPPDRPPA